MQDGIQRKSVLFMRQYTETSREVSDEEKNTFIADSVCNDTFS